MPPDAASVMKRRSLVPAPFALALDEDEGGDSAPETTPLAPSWRLSTRPSRTTVDPLPETTPLCDGVLGFTEPVIWLTPPGLALLEVLLFGVSLLALLVGLPLLSVDDVIGEAVLGVAGVDEGDVEVELEGGVELVDFVLSRLLHAVTEATSAINSAGSMTTLFFMVYFLQRLISRRSYKPAEGRLSLQERQFGRSRRLSRSALIWS